MSCLKLTDLFVRLMTLKAGKCEQSGGNSALVTPVIGCLVFEVCRVLAESGAKQIEAEADCRCRGTRWMDH